MPDKKAKQSSEHQCEMDFENTPSTVPNISVSLTGFENESLARTVGQAIQGCLFYCGKVLNLELLENVIVAHDYKGALSALERGVEGASPLTPTQDEIAIGIAMTPTIFKDGQARSVIVLDANYVKVLGLESTPSTEESQQQIYFTIAHECGHVHDLAVHAKSFPDVWFKPTKMSGRSKLLFEIASGCWKEYVASRLSAFMAPERVLKDYEDTFCTALEKVRGVCDAAIRQYRMHGDIPRVLNFVAERYKSVLVYQSYLVGHIDGLNVPVETSAPRALQLASENAFFNPFFDRLHRGLRELWSTYGNWATLEVYEPLKSLAYELLRVGGMDVQDRGDDMYVEIPFRPETMPTFDELLAYRLPKTEP